MALNALVTAATRQGYQQQAIVGTPASDPRPAVANLNPAAIHPLAFGGGDLPFALPGMSDVMPYESSVFAQLSDDQWQQYRTAWGKHVTSVIERFQPDLIHSHHVWILSSMLKDLASDVPVVTHCHATGLRQLSLCSRVADQVRTGCARNDSFVVLHRQHADDLQTQLKVPAEQIHVVGSGYNEEVFHDRGRAATPLSILYAGKLSYAKGVPQLLDVMDGLAASCPNARLCVAGAGAGSEAEEILARLETMANVEYVGQVDQPRLAQLLRASTTFVLPSYYEGLPLVLVEAAACGCHIVSTELPGVLEQLAPVLGSQLSMVSLPEMAAIDQPHPAAVPAFVNRLQSALLNALHKGEATSRADLTSMTWNGVFARVQEVWHSHLNA